MSRLLFLILALLPALAPAQEEKKPAKDPSEKSGKEEPAAEKPDEEPEKKPVWTAITGGRVYPISSRVMDPGTVLLKDDKIFAVGRDVVVPEGATVVDARGKHVCPGFVASAARGALGVRGHTSKEKAKDLFDPFSDTMLMCLSSGITTAHEGPGGRGGFASFFGGGSTTFSGSPKGTVGGYVGKLAYGTLEGFELRDPCGVYMSGNSLTASQALERLEALEKAQKHHEKKKAWLKDLIDGKKDAKKPKTDDVTEALVGCLEGKKTLFMSVRTRQDIEAALQLVDRFDIPMVLAGAREAWVLGPEIGRRPVKLLLCHRGTGGRREMRPYRQRYVTTPHGWTIENAATMSKAGVPWGTVTMGTSVITSLFAGRDLLGLPIEAAFAVRGGATEAEALRSITLTAAEILGVDDRVGSLDRGKDADVLVMDLDPLDYRSFVEKAWVNGRLVYEKDKVAFWSHIQTDRSKGMKPWTPWGPWPDLQPKQVPDAGGDDNGGGDNAGSHR